MYYRLEEVRNRERKNEMQEKEIEEERRAQETRQAELTGLFDIANRKRDIASSAIANVFFILFLY